MADTEVGAPNSLSASERVVTPGLSAAKDSRVTRSVLEGDGDWESGCEVGAAVGDGAGAPACGAPAELQNLLISMSV